MCILPEVASPDRKVIYSARKPYGYFTTYLLIDTLPRKSIMDGRYPVYIFGLLSDSSLWHSGKNHVTERSFPVR